jgi:hypothetical protein
MVGISALIALITRWASNSESYVFARFSRFKIRKSARLKCLFRDGIALPPKFLAAKRNVVREIVRWSPFARAVTLI